MLPAPCTCSTGPVHASPLVGAAATDDQTTNSTHGSPSLKAQTLLTICDDVEECNVVARRKAKGGQQSWIRWLGQPSHGHSTFLHTTRCNATVAATIATSFNGHKYKACAGGFGTFFASIQSRTTTAAGGCRRACNSEPGCAAYQTSPVAGFCQLFATAPQPADSTAYFKLQGQPHV